MKKAKSRKSKKKPTKVLAKFRDKMATNLITLDNIVRKRGGPHLPEAKRSKLVDHYGFNEANRHERGKHD